MLRINLFFFRSLSDDTATSVIKCYCHMLRSNNDRGGKYNAAYTHVGINFIFSITVFLPTAIKLLHSHHT